MKRTFCYWSVAEGADVPLIEGAIRSARAAGVREEFHVWSPQPVSGAVHHPCLALETAGGIFKLVFLKQAVAALGFDAYVWLDPAHHFVREPGDVLRLLRGAPLHVPLEGDLDRCLQPCQETGGCAPAKLAEWMRLCGVRSRSVFAVSGGFFIVRREAVDTVYFLAREFWKSCLPAGVRLPYEPLLAYAMQMLCGNPYAHALEHGDEVWRCDHDGHWKNALPDGRAWEGVDCLGQLRRTANPTIVHLPGSRGLLRAALRQPPLTA